MRLVLLLDSPTYGGAEECVLQLVRGLPPAVARTVLATAPVPDRFAAAVRAAGSPLLTMPPVRGRPDGPDLVAAALAPLRPDVVHVNLIDPGTCVEALAGAVRAGAATVADVHMSGPLTDPRLPAAYRGCAAVLARSRRVADDVSAAAGLPADRVRVVGNGVSVPALAVPVRPDPAPLRIRGVGRLTAQKGFDLLIEATRRLVAAGLAVEVAVAGDGRDSDALVAAARGLPVTFAGFVADVPAFLRGADLFCLPSRAEALPLALLEAIVAGLPCVATDVGDVAATVAGLATVVPPGDVDALTGALLALARDPARRRRLAGRARAAAGRFDVRRSVGAVHAAYRAVLAVPAG